MMDKMKLDKKYIFPTIALLVIEILIGMYVQDQWVRPYGGDVLVVILIYTFLKIFWKGHPTTVAFSVLIFSFLVEFGQALGLVNLLGLQDYRLAVIIIGNSFAWYDLVAYTLGFAIILVWEWRSLLYRPSTIKDHTNPSAMNWNDVIHLAENGSPEPDRRVSKTEEEWQAQLTPEQYRVTRQKGTERPGTGAYCEAHAPGKYNCICCGEPLFDSTEKFESYSGWPSCTEPVTDNAIKYGQDNSHGMRRVEVMCNACGSHLGHVFPDGPAPTGLRFCINSASLKLEEQKK